MRGTSAAGHLLIKVPYSFRWEGFEDDDAQILWLSGPWQLLRETPGILDPVKLVTLER
jgi:hypothetical protein